MTELRWEKCRGNRYAGYDEDDFVALLKPIVFERDARKHSTYRAAEELLK